MANNNLTGNANFVDVPEDNCVLWRADSDGVGNRFCDCPYSCCRENTTDCPEATPAPTPTLAPTSAPASGNGGSATSGAGGATTGGATTDGNVGSATTAGGDSGATTTTAASGAPDSTAPGDRINGAGNGSATTLNALAGASTTGGVPLWALGAALGGCCLVVLVALAAVSAALRRINVPHHSNGAHSLFPFTLFRQGWALRARRDDESSREQRRRRVAKTTNAVC